MLRVHFLAFRYYSEFICVCFFAFVKKKILVDNSHFLSCRIAVYTTHVSNPYLSSNHTRMCSRTPARNTHESTDHSLYIKIVCFSLCEPCSTPEIFEFQTAPPRDRVSPYFHLCSIKIVRFSLCEPCSTPEIFEFQTAPPRDRVSPYFHLCS